VENTLVWVIWTIITGNIQILIPNLTRRFCNDFRSFCPIKFGISFLCSSYASRPSLRVTGHTETPSYGMVVSKSSISKQIPVFFMVLLSGHYNHT
jgi:hypothetical protein